MVRLVEGEERLTELSRMLAGLPESERGREAAAELLEGAHV
jgi:DNA repair ATPase RecN